MKYCGNCEETLPFEDFGVNRSRKDGLQTQCKSCRRLVNNEQYASNPNRRANIKRNNRLRITEVSSYVLDYKLNNPCAVCGEAEPCTLDFHHISSDKEFNISKGKVSLSLLRVKEEISKCVVLCSNCHRKVHADLLKL